MKKRNIIGYGYATKSDTVQGFLDMHPTVYLHKEVKGAKKDIKDDINAGILTEQEKPKVYRLVLEEVKS